ncbi:MAG: M28 family metallopeptidase [Ignavibacteriaceae bacterium]
MKFLNVQVILISAIILFSFTSCSNQNKSNEKEAEQSINAEEYGKHISILASDEFQGRQPSTVGEEKTINYLKDEFTKLGLKPGNGNSFFQEVPLVEIVTDVDPIISINGNGKQTMLKHKDDYVAVSSHVTNENIELKNAELIFAGYGIVAPEYNWNDYAGLDVNGKIVVVLVNDPGFVTGDSSFFTGKQMTYYGRWTYKYEEAARQGAAGVFIVHQTAPASYPWEVVKSGWSGPQFYLVSGNNNLSNCKMEGWISNEKAKEIFSQANLDFDKITSSAAKPGFKAIPLNLKTSLSLKNKTKESLSHNVIAVFRGSEQKDEYIIYTAHWDHFGVDSTLPGDDKIYNGARDNATGTAALIELAKAFTKLNEAPKRSIIFLAVTAEEQGLLGSGFYAKHPIYPLKKTVAEINIDALNIFGRMKDITIIGYGNSELDSYVEEAAQEQNRIVRPDPQPERGSFYRSDHFNFAKYGVPSLYAKGGDMSIEKGQEWAKKTIDDWTEKYYHKPEDNYDPSWWNLSGTIDDIQLLFNVGYKLSNEDKFPNWYEGNEFKSIRDAEMISAP